MQTNTDIQPPTVTIEHVTDALIISDLNDLCDATDQAIIGGGGFGWVELPAREILERYWQGVVTMQARTLFVSRLDGVICGTAQLIHPPKNNQAQSFSVQIASMFVTPWARKYGVGKQLLKKAENMAGQMEYEIINMDMRETQSAAIGLCEANEYQLVAKHPAYAKIDGQIIAGRFYYKNITDLSK